MQKTVWSGALRIITPCRGSAAQSTFSQSVKFPDEQAANSTFLPSGYYKFTREVASQTPCFSSLAVTAVPPPITVGLAANPSDTSRPTSAIVNLAWAMAYKVKTEPTPLSKGAVVGIGVGASLAAIAIIAGAAFVCLRWRRQSRRAGAEHLDSHLGMTYESGYHAPRESGVPLRALERPYSDHREGAEEQHGLGYGHGNGHWYGQRAGDGYYQMQ